VAVKVPTSTTGSPDAAPGPDRTELSPDEFNAAVTAVTNAFGDPTRRESYLYVREATAGDGGLTASDVAQHFELHPNVARHHLEKLTSGGYLTVAFARADETTGSRPAGRPSKRYRATELDHALALPLRHDDVLATLLVRALDALGPARAEELADEVGFAYGQSLAERMEPGAGHRSARTALAAVADALTAHGFAAHAESENDELSIVSECCPFGDTATEYPHVVCALDRGMIRGMLARLYGETSPRFDVSRPDGADHCVARV
jgi:predicted ArsR family transcriptional regulator